MTTNLPIFGTGNKRVIKICLFNSEKKIHVLSLRGCLLNMVVFPRSTLHNFTYLTYLLFYKISDNKFRLIIHSKLLLKMVLKKYIIKLPVLKGFVYVFDR